ncbi:hypothetical protein EUX98_g6483 [Antrodiella citrinella]|uniref:Glycosyltransferase 61 catalytic domain-containing protein n=1 Tax=Antrodiella citrinella TaxID=2447956 RepID=A0A4S4MNV4_9APHY|nr:hypothetical protein EUX98_g6483 [Antrodiella citrinella]
MGKLAFARARTLRDVVLILVGATCMHLASNFLGFLPEQFTGDIIVSTHINQHGDPMQALDEHPLVAARPPAVKIPKLNPDAPPKQHAVQPLTFPSSADLSFYLPETTIDAHAPGWTVFRNLYMSNGTLFIVSSQPPSSFPHINLITSTGLAALNTPENIAARIPTAEDMDFITPQQALDRWGPVQPQTRNRVWTVAGNTWLINDPSQFLDHYYHFCAELLVGAWAFWSGAHDAGIDSSSPDVTTAPPVHRAIFAHAEASGWRDRPGFNSWFFRAAFPSLSVEVQQDWQDRIASTAAPGKLSRAWHFERVLFADRSAAFRGEVCGAVNQRTAAEAYHHMQRAGNLTKWWWEPVRRSVLRFGGVTDKDLDIPVLAEAEAMSRVAPKPGDVAVNGQRRQKVVVTYISRQGARRHLIDEDHAALVVALDEMCALGGWELNVVQAEKLSKEEQVTLMARTTILLGVHGNGLTHLILLPPTPISTVIEIFYPGGFAHDYEWTTRAMGMKHFAVRNDTWASHPRTPVVAYPEGFQGTQIPVHAPTIVKIIEDRVAGKLPNSEFLARVERMPPDARP